MMQTIEAVFDGKVLRPNDQLALAPNTKVRLTIEVLKPAKKEASSFLCTARSLALDGPPDWAERIDAYLYGGNAGQ